MEFEVYFDDLKEEAQKELLEKAGLTSPADANWDVYPITTIYIEEE